MTTSLAAAIKARGITQADIAQELNVSPAWVSQRLSGKRGSIADLEAIAEAAGLSCAWHDAAPAEHWHDVSLLTP